MRKTRGQLQAEISDALIKFERDYMGRGPLEAKTYIIDDMVVVRLKAVLTPAEHQLAKSLDGGRGRGLIKQVRAQLLEQGRHLLEEELLAITGVRVTSLHTDISTVTGERIIIFTMQHALDTPPGKLAGKIAVDSSVRR